MRCRQREDVNNKKWLTLDLPNGSYTRKPLKTNGFRNNMAYEIHRQLSSHGRIRMLENLLKQRFSQQNDFTDFCVWVGGSVCRGRLQ